LALVGCGWIAEAHVAGYGDLMRRGCTAFTVTACCDPNVANAEKCAQAIAQFQGAQPAVFASVDELIAARAADAADVCVPHAFHHRVAIPLLAGGLHVMVEKPMGITIKASRAIIAAAEKYGRVLAYGENVRRYLPARACTWAIHARRMIGDVRLVNIHSVERAPFDYDRAAFKWRGSKLLTGGGMIMDSGAHLADMVQLLFGEPDEVVCTMATYDDQVIAGAPVLGDTPADVEDTWHAVIRFRSGLHLTWTYSRQLYGEPVRIANYYGSAGTLRDLGFPFHPFQAGAVAVLADGKTVSSGQIETEYALSLSDTDKARLFPYGATDGFAIEVWDFVDAIATGRKPEMDGLDGLRAKALCETCYEAAVAGRPVRYADVLEGRVNAYQKPIDDFWQI